MIQTCEAESRALAPESEEAPGSTDPIALSDVGACIAGKLADAFVFDRGLPDALASSGFHDPGLLVRALACLASRYRAMRRGLVDPEECRRALADLGLEERETCPSGSSNERELKHWMIADGVLRFADRVIVERAPRDPARRLCIYLSWDAETERVVLCDLPWSLD